MAAENAAADDVPAAADGGADDAAGGVGVGTADGCNC